MEKEKKTSQVSLKLVITELGIIVFYTVVWLSGLIFDGFFNIWYFLLCFISLIGFIAIVLCSKDKPQVPDKRPTQKFCNFIKAVTDAINIQYNIGKPVQVEQMKGNIQNMLVFSLRNAMISSEFDKNILEATRTYMFDKLKKEEVKNGN